jgi:hypothetical protein
MNKHANLIYQLKQHARIGMPDPPDPKDTIDSNSKAAEVAGKTTTRFNELSEASLKTANSMTDLTNATQLVSNQMKALKEALPSLKTLMKEIGTVVSNSTGATMGFSRGLGIIIAQQRKYSDGIKTQVKANTYLEESNRGLATTFNLNRESAADFMHALRGQATTLGIGDEKLASYAGSLDGLARGFINVNTMAKSTEESVLSVGEKMLAGQTIMQNQLGISEQEAQAFESFSAGLKMTSADNLSGIKQIAEQMANTGAFAGVDPLQMQKDIITDIAELSADTQMQYSRYPAGLAKATQYAKKLGMSMEQLHKTGKAFLNIEQSIGQELEYQLISGQRLLTEQGTSLTNEYRMATIKGDGLKQAQLMSRFLEDQAGTLENNMYAREKAAELFGIDEAALSKSIQKQKLLNSLGATNLVEMANGDMEEVYTKLAEGGASEKQIEALKTSMDTRSTEQVANDHLAKIESYTLQSLTQKQMGTTGKASTIVATASTESLTLAKSYDKLITMFNDPRLATILGQAGAIGGALTPMSTALNSLTKGIPGLDKASAGLTKAIEDLSTVSIIGGTVTEPQTVLAKKAGTVNDALLMNDGVVQFNKADKFMKVSDSTMIAGTNVDGNKKLARAITTGGGASIDYNQMAMAIVSAMKSATFVATVKPDLLFNGKKY